MGASLVGQLTSAVGEVAEGGGEVPGGVGGGGEGLLGVVGEEALWRKRPSLCKYFLMSLL